MTIIQPRNVCHCLAEPLSGNAPCLIAGSKVVVYFLWLVSVHDEASEQAGLMTNYSFRTGIDIKLESHMC